MGGPLFLVVTVSYLFVDFVLVICYISQQLLLRSLWYVDFAVFYVWILRKYFWINRRLITLQKLDGQVPPIVRSLLDEEVWVLILAILYIDIGIFHLFFFLRLFLLSVLLVISDGIYLGVFSLVDFVAVDEPQAFLLFISYITKFLGVFLIILIAIFFLAIHLNVLVLLFGVIIYLLLYVNSLLGALYIRLFRIRSLCISLVCLSLVESLFLVGLLLRLSFTVLISIIHLNITLRIMDKTVLNGLIHVFVEFLLFAIM